MYFSLGANHQIERLSGIPQPMRAINPAAPSSQLRLTLNSASLSVRFANALRREARGAQLGCVRHRSLPFSLLGVLFCSSPLPQPCEHQLFMVRGKGVVNASIYVLLHLPRSYSSLVCSILSILNPLISASFDMGGGSNLEDRATRESLAQRSTPNNDHGSRG